MNIYIPSRSRSDRCLTLEQLGPMVPVRWPVALVVPVAQANAYKVLAKRHNAVLLPCPEKGISRTRQWIGQNAATHRQASFLMLDDDLRFAHRDVWRAQKTAYTDGYFTLAPNGPKDNVWMVADIERALEHYAHVSIGARGDNRDIRYEVKDPATGRASKVCVRAIRALGFQTHYFNTCTHGRVQIMEDFDVALQLIARGLPNCDLRHWAQDQSQTQARGGCSDYRTHEFHEKYVKALADLWPGIVTLRLKQNKTGGAFGTRTEATIMWKKALGLYGKDLCT